MSEGLRCRTVRLLMLRGAVLGCLVLQLFVAAAQPGITNPIIVFSDLSSRMLQQEFGLQLDQVQISPTNRYTSAVHRLIQVAANITEAMVDSPAGLPLVYRPCFRSDGAAVFLSHYVLVNDAAELGLLPRLDLAGAVNPGAALPSNGAALVYGVPLVVGARKGLPNFNEFSIAPEFTLTRRLQLVKPNAASTVILETNQFYNISLTLPQAAEFWNAYGEPFNRPVTISITNQISLVITNDVGVHYQSDIRVGDRCSTNSWLGFRGNNPLGTTNKYSFVTTLLTNLPLLPPTGGSVGYLPNIGFVSTSNGLYDAAQTLLMPRWGMVISNRVQAMIVDESTGRLIDCVLLGNMVCATNLSDIIIQPGTVVGNSVEEIFRSVWMTNSTGSDWLSGRPGVDQQIGIARGMFGSSLNSYWSSYSLEPPINVAAAIAAFQNFFTPSALTNRANVPFSASVKFALPMRWQANDSLVHYLAEDLIDREALAAAPVLSYVPVGMNRDLALDNIGKLNNRYAPWGWGQGDDPNLYDPSVKDAGLFYADRWLFPTNVVPHVSWLGQVHRGTPWQTIYLKAPDLDRTNSTYSRSEWLAAAGAQAAPVRWSRVTSTPDREDSFHSRPVQDRAVVALLHSRWNTNPPLDLLSINAGIAEQWLVRFDGMTALTNVASLPPYYEVVLISSNSPQAVMLAEAIATERLGQPGQRFRKLGELLAVPELSTASPWLHFTSLAIRNVITDEGYEKIPSQLLALLRADSVGEICRTAAATQVQFSGFDGYRYGVERSANLVGWVSVSTNYPTNGIFEFPVSGLGPTSAYYRSVLLP